MRVDAVPLGAGDQGVESGVGCAGFIMAGEEPVLSAKGDAFERSFRRVVVDVQVDASIGW